jgi:hypothetical protein
MQIDLTKSVVDLVNEALQYQLQLLDQNDRRAKWMLEGRDCEFGGWVNQRLGSAMNQMYAPKGYRVMFRQEIAGMKEHWLFMRITPNKDTLPFEALMTGNYGMLQFRIGRLQKSYVGPLSVFTSFEPDPATIELLSGPAEKLLRAFSITFLGHNEKKVSGIAGVGKYFELLPKAKQETFRECLEGMFYPPHTYAYGATIAQITDPNYREELRKAVVQLKKEAK